MQTAPGGEYINEFNQWESYPPTYGIRWLESPKVFSINTKTGNITWSKSHERLVKTAVVGNDKKIYLAIDKTKYYNQGIHQASFQLPQFLKDVVPHKLD